MAQVASDGPANNEGLFRDEFFWRDHYAWLLEQGYLLRPRYRPGWRPSWAGSKRNPDKCEDGRSTLYTTVLDAFRRSDNVIVAIKRLSKSRHPSEVGIAQIFSEPSLANDPHNHAVPVYQVLDPQNADDKDVTLLVMPYLVPFDTIPFDTVGEVVEFVRQLLDGVKFIHDHHVAHRDIMASNVMMDTSIYPEPPHPIFKDRSYDFQRKVKCGTRTERPVKYYLTDFGISCRLGRDDKNPRVTPIMGGDRSVPEYKRSTEPQNPYLTDIYCLGNIFRTQFLQPYANLDFLSPLVRPMVQDEPAARPTISKACSDFEEILTATPKKAYRSRLVPRGENPVVGFFKACRHAVRTAMYILTRKPALPTPKPASVEVAQPVASRVSASPSVIPPPPVVQTPSQGSPSAPLSGAPRKKGVRPKGKATATAPTKTVVPKKAGRGTSTTTATSP
ncbi:kinase-like domain-containing protein [Trametes polyzona]|nr:kinase-like domain-containing protein [Trametes polyzona]